MKTISNYRTIYSGSSRRICSKFNPNNSEEVFRNDSTSQLLGRAVLFKVLANNTFVTHAVKTANSILRGNSSGYMRAGVEFFVKRSVFRHFCAGENFHECSNLAREMLTRCRVTTIADCSSEDLVDEDGFEMNLKEKMNLLLQISDDGDNGIKFVPLKCTSLIDSGVLERLTAKVLMMQQTDIGAMDLEDREKFLAGIVRFERICSLAQSKNLTILLDAEESSRQPAVEVLARILFEKFNHRGSCPVVYNTYQTYLKRTPAALIRDMNIARDSGYVFAVKLVRGAYSQTELAVFRDSPHGSRENPLWPTKAETDLEYDRAIEAILQSIASKETKSDGLNDKPFVMIATHNKVSIEKAVETMRVLGIPNDHRNIHFAQILGMSDHLTTALADSGSC